MDFKTNDNNAKDLEIKISARKKEKNYTREEDIFLCMAWMATSKDPEEEIDQSSMTFWERIVEKYANLIGNSHVIRPKHSLLQRWSKIRVAVSTFSAIYRSIHDQNPNSYTEQDMIKMALVAYKKERKEKFKFLYCWTELRNSLKWKSEGASKVKEKNVAQQSSKVEHLSFNDENNFPITIDILLEQSNTQKLENQCAVKEAEAVVSSPSPLSSVPPGFICSSGFINFDPHDHTVANVQPEGSEQVKIKKKEKNYTRQEDIVLCKAWMGTREDPVKGKDESSMAVWERITEKYTNLIPSNYVSRTEKSLTQRWHKMRTDISKFCIFYNIVNDQNPTGCTELDKINKARVAYKKERKEKFRYHHCWTILRRSPKWNEVVSKKRLKKIVATYSQEEIISEYSSFDDDYDSPMTIEDTLSEELEGNIFPEESLEGCGEEEGASLPAASSHLSALCTPVILSRVMDSNTHDHVRADVLTEGSDKVNNRKKETNFREEEDVLSRDMDSNTHDHVRTDVPTEGREKVNSRKRETNYTEEEDKFLCRAWMAIDCDPDPILGKVQSSTTLWEKIGEFYASLIGNNHVPRSYPRKKHRHLGHSLPNRFSKIRNCVAKFCSLYKSIDDQNMGSYTELEKINMAALAYRKECKERFKFLHCWHELKHSPKWIYEMDNGVKFARRKTDIFSQKSSNGEYFSHNENDDSQMPTTPTFFDQSGGQKLMAQKRKARDFDTSSSDVEEILPKTHNLVREIFVDQPEAEKLAVPESQDLVRELLVQKVKKLDELLEIEREKRDTKIMLIDPTTITDGRRQYFEKLQQKIIERTCGIPPPSN